MIYSFKIRREKHVVSVKSRKQLETVILNILRTTKKFIQSGTDERIDLFNKVKATIKRENSKNFKVLEVDWSHIQ